MPSNLHYKRRLEALTDRAADDVPAIPRITRSVASISADIAQELDMVQCPFCQRFYAPEQIIGLICDVCAEERETPDDGRSWWFEDRPPTRT